MNMITARNRFASQTITILSTVVLLFPAVASLGVPRDDVQGRGLLDRAIPVQQNDESESWPSTSRPDPVLVATGGGADFCQDAKIVPVVVGPPGSPNTVVINGDNSTASVSDCTGLTTAPTWWEAFEIDKCATVTLNMCGTTPVARPSYAIITPQCPCGDFVFFSSVNRTECGDENITVHFDALAPGVYYYPVLSDDGLLENPRGPYTINIIAEECVGSCDACVGGCCDTNTSACVEDTASEDCTGAGEVWSNRPCCEMECRPPGPEYDSLNMNLLSRVPLEDFTVTGSTRANDIWGYTSPLGRQYAIIGLDSGTGFVDITDPRNPEVLADIPDATSTWSDMRIYQHYAYNVNESGGGMQIFDLSQIDPPDRTVTLLGALTQSGLQTAHNIAVNEASGFAYLSGSNLSGGSLLAIDLADPANPQIAGISNDIVYVHDAQVVTYTSGPYAGREIAFCFNGSQGLWILDVTDKSDMFTIGTMTYPTMSYCHQGWYTEDLRYIIMNDELDEANATVASTTTYVVDIQDLSNPTLVSEFTSPGCWIDHNLLLRGDRVYQAHYTAGVRVLDAADPLNLSEMAYFDTHPGTNSQSFSGAWGVFPRFASRVVAASDIQRGLLVLCDDPDRPIASFTMSANNVSTGQPVTFDASASAHCDPGGTIVSYIWEFGDASESFRGGGSDPMMSHKFPVVGVYPVTLTVIDESDMEDSVTLEVHVTTGGPVPATSSWTLLALALIILAAGTVRLRKPSVAV